MNNIEEARQEWSAKYQFSWAFAAIDCTHIRNPKQSEHGNEYYNRKCYFSMNVQATCNVKEEITSIDAQWLGQYMTVGY